MVYRKKPITVQATQWWKNGDHPSDGDERFTSGEFEGELFEGRLVRYFRRPDVDERTPCHYCARPMKVHGWIDTKEGGHIVCPGDFIITGVQGESYPCKPDIFGATYDPVIQEA